MKRMSNFILLLFAGVLATVLFIACQQKAEPAITETSPSESTAATESFKKPRVPDWHKNATIYEVNMRQFTEEGTFKAFQEHLPRLKKMGVDILWFMPIHPVSKINRKGSMGSPYAVGDYLEVNPDMGTMKDFKNLLAAIHEQGMYCIIDWVPNHTGWDNPWITEHPDWYTKDKDGEITDPINPETGEPWGWTDVADLNYEVPEMRAAMIDAMSFWVKEVGVDGFRVDVAHGVPADFWEEATDALYAIEPLFMLAEAEIPELVNKGYFVMDYGWEMHHTLNQVAKYQGAAKGGKKLVKGNLVDSEGGKIEKKTVNDIHQLLEEKHKTYQKGYQMQFTSNHDENSWAGTEFERMGDGHQAFAVLTATFDGMPLVYTGMESAMDKQLAFFEKDAVKWGDYKYADFYQTLFDLKHRNQALWNGAHGGELVRINTEHDEEVYAFVREKNGDKVVAVINLSPEELTVSLSGEATGNFKEIFTKQDISIKDGMEINLAPWGYHVYSNQ